MSLLPTILKPTIFRVLAKGQTEIHIYRPDTQTMWTSFCPAWPDLKAGGQTPGEAIKEMRWVIARHLESSLAKSVVK